MKEIIMISEEYPGSESLPEMESLVEQLFENIPFHSGDRPSGVLAGGASATVGEVQDQQLRERTATKKRRGVISKLAKLVTGNSPEETKRASMTPESEEVYTATRSFFTNYDQGVPGTEGYTGRTFSVYQQRLVTAGGLEVGPTDTYVDYRESKDAGAVKLILGPMQKVVDRADIDLLEGELRSAIARRRAAKR